ncbi:ATP-dependent DNA helicase 2 subunit KU70-like [Zingiber officinale]|uniref:ATP-dependent DNA helicase 2 subunit KU70-like n=1 Tax=Zingiber officinale TaxID=94328 RepID=UPI001C4BF090|nr:ATP-dependent DNA helicase 2 subunit KU70-like [Zingiber officinale]
MDLDPEGIFRDDSDSDAEFHEEKEATKDLAVYLIDASPKMFAPVTAPDNAENGTYFHVVIDCISQSLKSQIINRLNDEVALCFFNTKEKKNLQDLNGVYVFNVEERDFLDQPTAKLIKEFSSIENIFMNNIGSRYGILPGSRDNSLYNALWVAQALLRKGSAKTASKRILIFTNEDDPFGSMTGAIKADMIRTTLQRAEDAKDLGISLELLPLGSLDEEFNLSKFYAEMIGLEGDELVQYLPSANEKLMDMKDQLRKRIFNKRKVRTLTFSIINGISIQVNTYALIRPTLPGATIWLDSVTNLPLKIEKSLICADTGALIEGRPKLFHSYKNQRVLFSVDQISEIKKVSNYHLRLLGFKPIDCLKDYHNLRPSTFIFPTDEEIIGSTRIFIALYRSMLHLKRFALAFYGSSSSSRLVALVAQDEIVNSGGQLEPAGMHMIYLPYSDDIRDAEQYHISVDAAVPRASDDQIQKASALMKQINLENFSVLQFANPALQRHYGLLQVLALDEDEMPDFKDETLPDEKGLARRTVFHALEDFKVAVYGQNHDQEETEHMAAKASGSEATRKRKMIANKATGESAKYDWEDLAENGKLKDLTVVELKFYLTAHNLPVTGKKDALISRILTHMGK